MRKIFQAGFCRGFTFYLNGGTFFLHFFAASCFLFLWTRGVQHQQAGYQYGSKKAKTDQVFFLHGSGFGMGRK